MARTSSKDPLDKFRFKVTIEGFSRLGFTSVDMPSVDFSTTEYYEGGAHLFPRQIIDKATYKPVTLKRGVTMDASFVNWIVDVYDILVPDGSSATNPLNGPNPVLDYRRQVIIEHLDRAGRTIKKYTLFNALPTSFKPGSDFAADGDDTFSIEEITLKYESFKMETPPTDGSSATNVKDISKRLTRNLF